MSRANKAQTRCTYTDPEQNDYIGDTICQQARTYFHLPLEASLAALAALVTRIRNRWRSQKFSMKGVKSRCVVDAVGGKGVSPSKLRVGGHEPSIRYEMLF